MKIYLSASQQPNNIYADRVFNEELVMHKLVALEKVLLDKFGYEVRISDPKKTMIDNIKEANEWGADIYVAHHTNAYNGTRDGALGLHFPSAKSKKLCECIYEEVAKAMPNSDEGIRPAKELAELRLTRMTSCLIEYFYHDSIEDMKNGILCSYELAEATVRGIWAYILWLKNEGGK